MDNQGRFDRLDDKLDALTDKWDNRLNQIDEKWDEKFGDIYKMLHEHSLLLKEHGLIHQANSASLIEHVRRTNLLSDQLETEIDAVHKQYEPLKKKHDSMVWLVKVVSGVAMIVGTVWGVVTYFIAKK